MYSLLTHSTFNYVIDEEYIPTSSYSSARV